MSHRTVPSSVRRRYTFIGQGIRSRSHFPSPMHVVCVLARRVARRCHIAWSHRLSAGVILSLARASILEAPCSSEGGHEPRHVLANPAISMSANVYLGLRKTLHFCPQQTSTKNLHLTVPVRCRWKLMFVVVDIAVLAIRFVIGNHFRRAGGQGGFSLMICRPECCDLSTRSVPSRPVPSVPSCPVPSRPVLSAPSRPRAQAGGRTLSL